MLTALVAAALALYPKTTDPIHLLAQRDVEMTDGYGLLNDLLVSIGEPAEPPTLNNVTDIRFPIGVHPTLAEFRLLTKFPNLNSLYLPCKIPSGAIDVLKNCPKLETLSLSNSNASDKLLPAIAKIPGLKCLATENTMITEQAMENFSWPKQPDAR